MTPKNIADQVQAHLETAYDKVTLLEDLNDPADIDAEYRIDADVEHQGEQFNMTLFVIRFGPTES